MAGGDGVHYGLDGLDEIRTTAASSWTARVAAEAASGLRARRRV
jgi:hypothetical protein